MRFAHLVVAAAVVAGVSSPAAADVQLSIQDGRVSLKATNATVREILAEWTKVGGTRIVNGERVPGGPMTIQLTSVPEDQALKIILRSAAGYVTAPRATVVANASRYDRILVMPTTSPARGAAPAPAPFPQPQTAPQFQNPAFPQPPAQFRPPLPINDDPDDQRGPVQNPSGPIFNTFPQPQINLPPGAIRPVAPATPGQMPVGVAVPGMVVPTPGQPGQPPGQREP